MDKLEPSNIAGRNVKYYSHYGKQLGSSLKVVQLPFGSAIPFLGTYTREWKTRISYKCLHMNVHNSIICNSQKSGCNPNLHPPDKWINKMLYIYTMDYYPVIKIKEVLLYISTQIDLKMNLKCPEQKNPQKLKKRREISSF